MITVERSKLGELFSGNLQQLKMARGNERLARLVVTNHVLYDTAAATFVSTVRVCPIENDTYSEEHIFILIY